MYGKIIDLPIKPVLDLMKKGNKASKKTSVVSMKLSEQDGAHCEEMCTTGIPTSISG